MFGEGWSGLRCCDIAGCDSGETWGVIYSVAQVIGRGLGGQEE